MENLGFQGLWGRAAQCAFHFNLSLRRPNILNDYLCQREQDSVIKV